MAQHPMSAEKRIMSSEAPHIAYNRVAIRANQEAWWPSLWLEVKRRWEHAITTVTAIIPKHLTSIACVFFPLPPRGTPSGLQMQEQNSNLVVPAVLLLQTTTKEKDNAGLSSQLRLSLWGGGVANVDLVVGVFILRDAGCVLCHLHHSSFSGRVHSTHVYYQQPLNEQQEQFYRLGHHRIQHLRTKDKEKNVWWITGESSNR